MLAYEAALTRILAEVSNAPTERVSLAEARGRFLAEEITAPIALPAFDNSAMDGYALLARDIKGASADAPSTLRLIGRISAGENFTGTLESGTCVRLFTGAAIPAGADAVIMQEDTRVDPQAPDFVQILDEVKPWENIRFRAEDIRPGAVVGNPGDMAGPALLGLLAAVGLTEVPVGTRAAIALLATGSELVEAGQPLPPGAIYESNRVTLGGLALQAGARCTNYPLIKDTLLDTRQALEKAFSENDFVITSGGVSVGELDFVKAAFEELGGELDFWKVAIRPGKPFVFGKWRNKFLFGLPGNPVSAFVTFLLLVRPALLKWQGARDTGLPCDHGLLQEPLVNRGDRRHFARVRIDPDGLVRSSGGQASHLLHSLATANGLVDVPPATTLAPGNTVKVLRWE